MNALLRVSLSHIASQFLELYLMRNNEDVIPIFQRFDWRYQDTDWKCQYCSPHTNDEFYKKYLLQIVPSEEETIFHQEETLNLFSLLLDADREKYYLME